MPNILYTAGLARALTARELEAYDEIRRSLAEPNGDAFLQVAGGDVFDLASELGPRSARIVLSTSDPAIALTTGSGRDEVLGASGGDRIATGEGDDAVTATGGAFAVSLGGGDDRLVLDGGQAPTGATLTAGSGTDTLVVSGGGDPGIDPGLDLNGASLTGFQRLEAGAVTATVAQLEAFGIIREGNGTRGAVRLDIKGGGALDLSAELGPEAAEVYASGAGNSVRTGSGADRLIGSGGDDALAGGGGGDRLAGEAGRDTLDGGTGADRMWGGAHSDAYILDAEGDQVLGETADGGRDTMRSSVDVWMPEHVEVAILTGRAGLRAYGSDGSDAITGNGGGNLIHGAWGNDTIAGGGGSDRLSGDAGGDGLTGGSGGDAFVFGVGFGRDRVLDFADDVDTLVFDDRLLAGRAAPAREIMAAARLVDGAAVFDFGDGDTLTVTGVSSLASLQDDVRSEFMF